MSRFALHTLTWKCTSEYFVGSCCSYASFNSISIWRVEYDPMLPAQQLVMRLNWLAIMSRRGWNECILKMMATIDMAIWLLSDESGDYLICHVSIDLYIIVFFFFSIFVFLTTSIPDTPSISTGLDPPSVSQFSKQKHSYNHKPAADGHDVTL